MRISASFGEMRTATTFLEIGITTFLFPIPVYQVLCPFHFRPLIWYSTLFPGQSRQPCRVLLVSTISLLHSSQPSTLFHFPVGTLSVTENQPVGTLVAEFNASDPDPNSTFTYSLVTGAGDSGNSFFLMDPNGSLQTAVSFDFETNSTTQSIRVEVRDEKNASLEATFNVTVLDDGSNDGAHEWFTVSGGQGSFPYYTFTDSSGQTPDFSTYKFFRGSTYMFINGGVSGNHPFMLGESYNDMNSNHVFGGPLGCFKQRGQNHLGHP